MPEPREIEISTSQFKYAARVWGDKKGLPTLALHGWLDNAATFDNLAPLLTELYIVALDFPGHGHSGHRPRGIKYHYLDYVEDVFKVAKALKWEKFNLLGHSLGAGIASIAAGTFPERIDRLMMVEGIGPMTREPEKSHLYLQRSIQQMERIADRAPPLYQNKEQMIEARAKVGDMTIESVKILIERGIIELKDGVTWRSDPRLRIASPSYLTEEQVNAFLSNISSPSILVTAESGLFTDRSRLDSRCEYVKQLKVETLPGGHHLHLDNPQSVAGILSEFFADSSK